MTSWDKCVLGTDKLSQITTLFNCVEFNSDKIRPCRLGCVAKGYEILLP